MKRIIEFKHQLGRLYWQIIKHYENFRYNVKRTFKLFVVFVIGIFRKMPTDYDNINATRKIIICAHPDDETIFFSSVIKQYKPYIICMSSRGNRVRRREFINMLKHYNVSGTMWNFPDVPPFKLTTIEWLIVGSMKRLKKRCPGIEVIYTHNSVGESGNPNHFAVSRAVKKIFGDKEVYLTSELPVEKGELIYEWYKEKEYIVKDIYSSQYKMLSMWCPWFDHYMKYEWFEKI